MQASFDPTAAYTFQLEHGHVRRSGGEGAVILPASLLADLCGQLDPDLLARMGEHLAASLSDGIRERLGAMSEVSLQHVVDQVGGELALLGLGSCSAERWGRALVLKLVGGALGGATADLLAGFFEGCLQRMAERPLRAVPVPGEEDVLRFILCSEATSKRVVAWREEGASFGDMVHRLNAGEGHVS